MSYNRNYIFCKQWKMIRLSSFGRYFLDVNLQFLLFFPNHIEPAYYYFFLGWLPLSILIQSKTVATVIMHCNCDESNFSIYLLRSSIHLIFFYWIKIWAFGEWLWRCGENQQHMTDRQLLRSQDGLMLSWWLGGCCQITD